MRAVLPLLLIMSAIGFSFAGCAASPPRVVWFPSILPEYEEASVRGFRVLAPRDWREVDSNGHAAVMSALRYDLLQISLLLPRPALEVAQRVPIWVERESAAAVMEGAADDGAAQIERFSGRGMVFHPSVDWLREHGLNPAKAGAVEICNAADYLAWRAHQPLMILHELAHAYHFNVFGYDDPEVIRAYEAACADGRYEQVNYALAPPNDLRRAYAMNNPAEYFAELSESYFGVNDYFPFNRRSLSEFDPAGYALIRQMWNLSAAELEARGR